MSKRQKMNFYDKRFKIVLNDIEEKKLYWAVYRLKYKIECILH